MFSEIDKKTVNTIRSLSIDMIGEANSGHPGLPLGASPMMYVLWSEFLKINPKTSRDWSNRDRFILSAGHGSALLYSFLFLSGFKLKLEDLKNFRQSNSLTPGHPEVNHTDGVEATTGPLGQGFAMGVGMAMVEAHLAAIYNKPQFDIVDHYTYVLCGDGDLMEGVSQEAASLAGHMKLNKLIVLYDSNDISLDGPTSKTFTENVGERFKSYGWKHILVKDGNNMNDIYKALDDAKNSEHPTLIEVKTIIGYGSVNQGTSKVHGSPLEIDDIKQIKKSYGMDEEKKFEVSSEVSTFFLNKMLKKGYSSEDKWNSLFKEYQEKYPDLAKQYIEAYSENLPDNWQKELPKYKEMTSLASRSSSSETLQTLSDNIPYLWGGSADLSTSNNTMIRNETDFTSNNYLGKNIWFGVREFAMASAMNGIQLHGGTRVYGGTFFVFVDYLKAAIRLSALQKLPVVYVLTHDSIAVGEDGPTHEPIEQLASLRSIPNLHVIRPADGNETVAAWEVALKSKKTPTVLVLSRQNLPTIKNTEKIARDGVNKGGYVISKQKGELPDGILIATGSEVNLAIQAQKELYKLGEDVSVVSMPSFDLFEKQKKEYKESVLPSSIVNRMSIEMASSFGWREYVKDGGKIISIDKFGMSGPGDEVIEKYNFTVDHIIKKYQEFS
ncbi:transketolase [Vagococcus carniphilus]|uniref:transketolase n=1 Tax=Vagococcus carniphilus TaxID=218144 RepID=UPI003BABC60F